MSVGSTRTRVAIVGGGPTGMLLALLLARAGVDCAVIEAGQGERPVPASRTDLLEQGTVDLLRTAGIGSRLDRQGLVEDCFTLGWDGYDLPVDLRELTGGKTVTLYAREDLVFDLEDALSASGVPIVREAGGITPGGIDTNAPFVLYRTPDGEHRVDCDYLAGCDGADGICRDLVPASLRTLARRRYPFALVHCLAAGTSGAGEPVYVAHENGFASRLPQAGAGARFALQCPAADGLADWPETRLSAELGLRLGPAGPDAAPVDISIAPLDGFVAAPMQHGRLFLAGAAAHRLPAIEARDVNLAASDVFYLSRALVAAIEEKDERSLAAYGETALARVWRSQRFADRFIALTHRFDEEDAFARRLRAAGFADLAASPATRAALAESYVGPPF